MDEQATPAHLDVLKNPASANAPSQLVAVGREKPQRVITVLIRQ